MRRLMPTLAFAVALADEILDRLDLDAPRKRLKKLRAAAVTV